MLETLLAAGANPHSADRGGRTPLFAAANAGSLAAVHTLLAHGAVLFPAPSTLPSSTCTPCSGGACRSGTSCCHPNHHHASATSTSSSSPSSSSPPSSAEDADDAAFLALRTTCPLAAAAAAARWPLVAALLGSLPPSYQQQPATLRSLRFLVWALASHKAFPREVRACGRGAVLWWGGVWGGVSITGPNWSGMGRGAGATVGLHGKARQGRAGSGLVSWRGGRKGGAALWAPGGYGGTPGCDTPGRT